jgi:hypothetical protein
MQALSVPIWQKTGKVLIYSAGGALPLQTTLAGVGLRFAAFDIF